MGMYSPPLTSSDEPVTSVRASYAHFIWGLPKQQAEFYPSLGISLMGAIGEKPTQIIQVSEESVAERAGLAVGDVLLTLGGQPIESAVDLRRSVANWRWGDVITAGIERDGELQDIVIPVRR